MRASDFQGRGAAVNSLLKAYGDAAPPHAALLLGPPGIGKRTLAGLLLGSLFCTAVGGGKPCGICPPCRRIAAGTHPDYRRIPEQKRVGVDEIRALIASLQTAPYEQGWRAVLIECAGAMTPQAQNCLLKTLEEPPPHTAFLLTATAAIELLPTIRSRCRIVRVPPLEDGAVARILIDMGVPETRAGMLAALSQGSVGDALRMRDDEVFWALRERVLEAVSGVTDGASAIAAATKLRDDKEDAARALDLLEAALSAALRGATMKDTGFPPEGMPSRALTTCLESVAQTRRMMASNVPWHAALEAFLLEYAEELRRWQS